MINLKLYQELLSLENGVFNRIDHSDAMVAIAYKVSLPSGQEMILKISERKNDSLRELLALTRLQGHLPVPKVFKDIPEAQDLHSAILMECLPGDLLKIEELKDSLAFELGSLLARLHLNYEPKFGDLIFPNELTKDPKFHFALKFEEGLNECKNNLPIALIEKSRYFFDSHVDLLKNVDGPCLIHRDFRPGNIVINRGNVQGIIDWASIRSGFAEEDFCPLEHGGWKIDSFIKKSFLEGYASIRKVPEYSAVMPLLRLSKAIATIGFTVKIGTWNNRHRDLYLYNRKFIESEL